MDILRVRFLRNIIKEANLDLTKYLFRKKNDVIFFVPVMEFP